MRSGVTRTMLATVVMLAATAAGAQSPVPGAAAIPAATHVMAGEIARVNVARGTVIVKLPAPGREVEVRVADDTPMSAKGRPMRLPELRPGERITIACFDDAGGAHQARRVKVGGRPPSPR